MPSSGQTETGVGRHMVGQYLPLSHRSPRYPELHPAEQVPLRGEQMVPAEQ